MSSSTEARFAAVTPPELRRGQWTRLGPDSGLGDAVTEHTLSTLAEQTRTAARAQGYSVGWAQGRREAADEARAAAEAEAARLAAAEAERAEQHRTAVAALTDAAARLQATLAEVTTRVEVQATELAWALTEELVGHEVRSASGADVVRRVLAVSPTGSSVRLHLHPDHLADSCVADLSERGVQAVADPALDRLDAVVEVDDHALDLRLSTAMARVREVLA